MLRRSGPRSPTRCVLADELVQAARPHPGGQRLALGRWLEERLGSGADGTAGGGHVPPMVARWARRPRPVGQRA